MSIKPDQRNVFVIQALEKVDAETLQRAGKILGKRLEQAIGVAQTQYLSGPRPQKLDVVTTRLRGSLEKSVTVEPDKARGTLGTNIPYAGFHEFGFKGSIAVREHVRILSETNDKGKEVDTRKAVRDKAGNIIGYSRTKRSEKTTKVTTKVKAHTRKLNYEGRPFLRPALMRVQPLILSYLKKLFQPEGTSNG